MRRVAQRLLRVVAAAAGAFFIVTTLSVLSDPAVRSAIRLRLRVMDDRYLGGELRRMYHREQVSQVPEEVPGVPDSDYAWLGQEAFLPVAHALGPTFYAGENSIPTLERGVAMGFRLFEVDLGLTTDAHVVCYHGADETEELRSLSYAAYLDTMRARGTDRCDITTLIAALQRHSEIHFVLDVKNGFDEVYRQLRAVAEPVGLGKRFIPQLYSFDQLPLFRKDRVFAGEIFTSYRSVLTNQEILRWARKLDVHAVTLTLERVEALRNGVPTDVAVLTHPVDDPYLAADLRRRGVRGIYTGYLAPRTIPELFARWTPSCLPPGRFLCGAGWPGVHTRKSQPGR